VARFYCHVLWPIWISVITKIACRPQYMDPLQHNIMLYTDILLSNMLV